MSGRGASRALVLLAAAALAACGAAGLSSSRAPALDSHDSRESPDAPSALDVLRGGAPLGGASDGRFARALTVRRFEFPQDAGPHPQFRHEWWYLTGHLRATDGARFGFELTFFRVALAPPPSAASVHYGAALEASGSRWRTNQIYVAHFAVTDVAGQLFHSTARYARDALGLAGARADPFCVWLGDWSLGATGGDEEWSLRAGDASYGLMLRLHALGAPVLNGDRGLSVKSDVPGSASYYYSIPRLEVEGTLTRAGSALPVSGLAWLDREWGSGSLGPREQGWDWFALQFANGSTLMFYSLRDEHGAPDPHSAGTWVGADGAVRPLSSGDVRIDVESHWSSPTGDRYPSRWRVRVSSLGVDAELTPLLADQELDTAPRYWEGDVSVASHASGRSLGQGYVELVGYGPAVPRGPATSVR
ncbi:MAG TPA: lipocalin-like domain-containing protein [Steroidobacteraceae bacterium]|nr:lipocalin-like domain-containing protein [Steroidobacteraceae bacterium]